MSWPMPVMISAGAITQTQIPADLAELPIRYYPTPLTPLPQIARWIERSAGAAAAPGRASRNGGPEELHLAGARVEPGADADGHRPLLVDVADRKTVGDGNAERPEVRR